MTDNLHRQLRELTYPEDSEMGIFFALAIPLDDPISTKAMSMAFFFEANYGLVRSKDERLNLGKRALSSNQQRIDRKTIYQMLESKFEALGFPGRPCLLRTICETTHWSLHPHNGLIGDLLRILFTPSSSLDEKLPAEYTKAERSLGSLDDCGTTYPLCPITIYDYITSELSM
ncbi:uncharacterized protein [Chelonus insularis]|uniref:uncharacterized protein n=1 Tax=Chelonus insularis TaxID=460826 RepID=UPI00158E3FFA|nr:uncharacterized protein LOC118064572 [Chelonus insularis]